MTFTQLTAPSLSGTTQVGDTLTITPGTYTPTPGYIDDQIMNGTGGSPPTGYTNVGGAVTQNGGTYVVRTADVGKDLVVAETPYAGGPPPNPPSAGTYRGVWGVGPGNLSGFSHLTDGTYDYVEGYLQGSSDPPVLEGVSGVGVFYMDMANGSPANIQVNYSDLSSTVSQIVAAIASYGGNFKGVKLDNCDGNTNGGGMHLPAAVIIGAGVISAGYKVLMNTVVDGNVISHYSLSGSSYTAQSFRSLMQTGVLTASNVTWVMHENWAMSQDGNRYQSLRGGATYYDDIDQWMDPTTGLSASCAAAGVACAGISYTMSGLSDANASTYAAATFALSMHADSLDHIFLYNLANSGADPYGVSQWPLNLGAAIDPPATTAQLAATSGSISRRFANGTVTADINTGTASIS